MDHRTLAELIFRTGVESVLPSRLIPALFSVNENFLLIGSKFFPLHGINNIYIIGAGKASGVMAAEVEKILGNRISEGHIIVKYGHSCLLNHIKVTEAGHPVPDSNGFLATAMIIKIAEKAGTRDIVICLLSGGGSALLTDFPEGSSPEEIGHLNDLLVSSGASIKEINIVRKHLSGVKGGQLARTVYPAILIGLILSDVTGNALDVIASGPTTPDPSTFQEAYSVLKKYKLLPHVSLNILHYLKKGINGVINETPKKSDIIFSKTSNFLIGTNLLALEAAKQKAIEYNINAIIIDDQLQGDTTVVAKFIVETSIRFKADKKEKKPVCLLFGGETTVKVNGKGLGGRNQHLALSVAELLREHPGITILCAGTDGNDGPTDAAGAVVDSETSYNAMLNKVNPARFLKEFDSYNFFKKAGGHVITGPTMTNVMDIVVVIIG